MLTLHITIITIDYSSSLAAGAAFTDEEMSHLGNPLALPGL